MSLDKVIEITRSNTELLALTEQYLLILDRLSRCYIKDMSNPTYKELVKNKIKIHKFFPGKSESEIINYLSEVLMDRTYKETNTFDIGFPKTIDYFR